MSSAPPPNLIRLLEGARRPLIFGHLRPDGDAVGSALGLMWLLRERGAAAEVSFADPLPRSVRFLPGASEIENRPASGHDLLVALDGSDAERYGDAFSAARRAGVPAALIDHHQTSTDFLADRWVDPAATATAEMIYLLARAAEWKIDPRAAICLATGCVTDTNAFTTDHTTPEVLETVATLVRLGAPLSTIIREAMHLRTVTEARLWGRVLATLQVDGAVAWVLNRRSDRREVGGTEGDAGGIGSFLRNIIGVRVAIQFIELDNGRVRISLRSEPSVDVGSLALSYGGGGHRQAAGATLDGPLERAVRDVTRQARLLAAAAAA